MIKGKFTLYLFIIVIILFASTSRINAQTATATVIYTGAQAAGCCTVCGQDYWCINNTGGCGTSAVCDTKTFVDPVPAGNIATNIVINYWSAQCFGNPITGYVNGNVFPTVNEANTGCLCSNNPCGLSASTTATYPCGISGYNYGASNTLQLCTGTDICMQRAEVVITYAPSNQSTPPAAPGSITGVAAACTGTTQTYSVGAVTGAATYTWSVPGTWSIVSGQGTTSLIVTVGAGSGNICVIPSNLCGAATSSCLAVSGNPLPTPYSVTGGGSFCSGGSGTAVNLGGSEAGVNYQLQLGGINTGAPVPGTGSAISFGNQTSPGTYTVIGTFGASSCQNNMLGSASITVNALPGVFNVTGGGSFCTGGSGVPVGLSGSESGVNYQLQIGGVNSGAPVSGTSSSISFGNQSAPGTYTIVAVNGTTSCTSNMSGNAVVVPNTNPVANAGVDVSICTGGTANLSATGGVNYNWGPSAGLSDPNISNPIASPAISTNYILTITDGTGCSATDDILVTVAAAPTANAGNDTTICNGSAAFLNASGGSTYTWSPGTGLSATNIANPVAFPVSSTTYTVTVYSGGGCTAIDNVTVNIAVVPTVNAGADVNICQGASANLNATGGVSYLWSPASTLSNANVNNPVATPSSMTTYIVTAYDALGCGGTDNVTVGFVPNPTPTISTSGQTGFCDSASVNVVLDAGNGYSNYTWSNGGSSQTAAITLPGTYNVTVTDMNGCTGISPAINVYIQPPMPTPVIYADGSASFCQGDSVMLYLEDPYYMYQWSSGSMTPHIYVFESKDYVVTVTDSLGCVQVSAPFAVSVTPQPIAYASYSHQMLDVSFYNFSLNDNSWNWDFGDGQTSALSDPTHLYAVSGVYTVVFTASNSCGSDNDTLVVNLPGPEGYNDYGNDISDLIIYPVPAKENIFVTFESNTSSVELRVHDVLGKLIYSETYNDINGKFLESIDMSGQAAGLYLLELRTENSISVRKFNKK
jgi:hypothetical protein